MSDHHNRLLIHRKTNERITGSQYRKGEHPPPPGVSVTHGLTGVLARATTVQGDHSVINDADWLLDLPSGRDIFTNSFVRKHYRYEDEEAGEAKPVKLG